jgi:glyceraldehyde 3-phosphate dehydrogenase
MKPIRVAINGFGRIGRLVYRVLRARGHYEVVAINDLASAETLAHLLKYDSVHGRYPGQVSAGDGCIQVDGQTSMTIAERAPGHLPWAELDIDVVVEATGIFRKREQCMDHIKAGAKKVVLTVPPADELDAMIVMGVNDDVLRAEHQIISNASCTTNCLAPLAKVLNDRFGIVSGLMTTVHAYTNDQPSADQVHKDLRRARAASLNIIPTTTGAARAVGKVIPELDGKLDGCALRVPVPNGSVVDLTAELERTTSRAELNAAFEEAARGSLDGILAYTDDPIVSSDIVGQPHSSIIDGGATMVSAGGKLVKVISWYDNEWGYSNRVVDLLALAHQLSLRKAA